MNHTRRFCILFEYTVCIYNDAKQRLIKRAKKIKLILPKARPKQYIQPSKHKQSNKATSKITETEAVGQKYIFI